MVIWYPNIREKITDQIESFLVEVYETTNNTWWLNQHYKFWVKLYEYNLINHKTYAVG